MAKEIKQIIKTAVKKYISLNKSMYIHENEIEINEFQPSKENSIHNLHKVLDKEPMRLLNKILMNSNHYHDYCASKKKIYFQIGTKNPNMVEDIEILLLSIFVEFL